MKRTVRLLALMMALLLGAAPIAHAQEPVEIKWLGYYTSNITVSPDTQTEKLLEDTFSVKITPITDVTADSFGLYMSSGDVLEATCFATFFSNDFSYLTAQDLIREIPEEMLYEYYPTGMKIYEDFLGKEFFEKGRHKVDGKCLYVPFTSTTNTSEYVTIYRQDWLRNLGLEEPKTLDEFHDMLYAFTYNDPDGNGVKDTYGVDMSWGWMGLWPVYGAFGFVNDSASGNFVENADGTVSYTTVTDAYQQALTLIKQWYDEGIIDPECITDNRNAVRTKWAAGSIGVMVDSQTWFYSQRGAANIIALAEGVFGENTVDVLGGLTTAYGDGKVHTAIKYPNTHSNMALVFTADATDEQVIAVLRILEGMAADHDLYIQVVYGQEGADYTWEGEQLKINESVNIEYQAKKGLGDTFFGLAARDPYISHMTFSERDRRNIEKAESWEMDLYWYRFAGVPCQAYDTYYAEVKKVESEFYSNVLLGTADVEKDWDEYVAKMQGAGLDKILAEYETILSK